MKQKILAEIHAIFPIFTIYITIYTYIINPTYITIIYKVIVIEIVNYVG